MTLTRRMLVQFGALLPVGIPVLGVLAAQLPAFPRAQLLPAWMAIALTSFLCIRLGLNEN